MHDVALLALVVVLLVELTKFMHRATKISVGCARSSYCA